MEKLIEYPGERGEHKGFWLVSTNRQPLTDKNGDPLPTSIEPSLAGEIHAKFPGRKFCVCCHGDKMTHKWEKELTSEDLAIVNGIIKAHKAAETVRIDAEYP